MMIDCHGTARQRIANIIQDHKFHAITQPLRHALQISFGMIGRAQFVHTARQRLIRFIQQVELIAAHWLAIAAALVASTLLTLAVTVLVFRATARALGR